MLPIPYINVHEIPENSFFNGLFHKRLVLTTHELSLSYNFSIPPPCRGVRVGDGLQSAPKIVQFEQNSGVFASGAPCISHNAQINLTN